MSDSSLSPCEVRFGDPEIETIRLEGDRVVVGRGAPCEAPRKHPTLSYEHAVFIRTDEGWTLQDLGSTNGTAVDDELVKDAPRLLQPGSRIRLGTLQATFHDPSAAPTPAAPTPAAPPEAREPKTKESKRTEPKRTEPKKRESTRTKTTKDKKEQKKKEQRKGESTRTTRKRKPESSNVKPAIMALLIGITFGAGGYGLHLSQTQSTQQADAGSSPQQPPPTQDPTEGDSVGEEPAVRTDPAPPTPEPTEDPIENPIETLPPSTDLSLPRNPPEESPEPRDDPAPGSEPLEDDPEPRAAEDRPEAEVVRKTKDPRLTRALQGQDAGAIARLLLELPDALQAPKARRKLEQGVIYCLRPSGSLAGGGDRILRSAFPLHCAPSDLSALRKVSPDLRIEERILRVRYTNDYSKGLGRQVGKHRLAPHPKEVTIELLLPRTGEDPKRLAKLEAKSKINSKTLPPEGLTDQEVWERLLGPLGDDLRDALNRS